MNAQLMHLKTDVAVTWEAGVRTGIQLNFKKSCKKSLKSFIPILQRRVWDHFFPDCGGSWESSGPGGATRGGRIRVGNFWRVRAYFSRKIVPPRRTISDPMCT